MKWFKRERQPARPRRAAPAQADQGARPRRVDWRSRDPIGPEYERVVAPFTDQILEPMLRAAGLPAGARVLDVGCGTGAALPLLAAAGVAATGCDPSTGMLGAGRLARPSAPMVAADTINLPFRDARFDAVLTAFSLEYAPKLETALFDVKRVLRPGATLIVASWEQDVDELTKTWLELVQQTLGVEMFRHARQDAEPWAGVLGHRARLETTLRDAGFRPVVVTREKIRLEMSLDDYLAEKHLHPLGRFVRQMLRDRWDGFVQRERETYATRFGARVVDLRDLLIAAATKP